MLRNLLLNNGSGGQWWRTPLIPALGRQRQTDFWVRGQPVLQSEFQDSQGYTEKTCLKKKKKKRQKTKKVQSMLSRNWGSEGALMVQLKDLSHENTAFTGACTVSCLFMSIYLVCTKRSKDSSQNSAISLYHVDSRQGWNWECQAWWPSPLPAGLPHQLPN
jgi:hypothetical protein